MAKKLQAEETKKETKAEKEEKKGKKAFSAKRPQIDEGEIEKLKRTVGALHKMTVSEEPQNRRDAVSDVSDYHDVLMELALKSKHDEVRQEAMNKLNESIGELKDNGVLEFIAKESVNSEARMSAITRLKKEDALGELIGIVLSSEFLSSRIDALFALPAEPGIYSFLLIELERGNERKQDQLLKQKIGDLLKTRGKA